MRRFAVWRWRLAADARFLTPRAVLEECSLEELADYYERYCALYVKEDADAF